LIPEQVPLYNAMKKMPGVETPIDGEGGVHGLFWFTNSIDPINYQRSYSRTGHWDGLNRTNYEILVGHKVNQVLFNGDTAIGVQFYPRGDSRNIAKVAARREVILSAGAIHSPQILQLSGIGPADLLTKANISVRVDLPGVGANFQDHYYLPDVRFSCESLFFEHYLISRTVLSNNFNRGDCTNCPCSEWY
jgi:choline dehydrogenase-like flavoprotein